MTILIETIVKDERFQRCLKARQTGRVKTEYKAPFRSVDQFEKDLERMEAEIQKVNDTGIHELAAYLRDFVGLLRDYEVKPESLELALQEFGVSKS